MMDTQISQMAKNRAEVHNPGTFPSNAAPNPKGSHQCNAISLRSGTSCVNHPDREEELKKAKTGGIELEDVIKDEGSEEDTENEAKSPRLATSLTPKRGHQASSSENSEKHASLSGSLAAKRGHQASSSQPCRNASMSVPYVPKAPYPHALVKSKQEEKYKKFTELFQKVQINIPLLDAIRDMPGYMKFLKDAVSNKKKIGRFGTISLTEECSAVLQRKLPQKKKDPGSFNITCMIGDHSFTKVLLDLGASINLMPLSIYHKLELSNIKPTDISLLMADRSVTYPKGIVENVLVWVDKFAFPADFVVLDIPEDRNQPLILGRPFLATGRALIDVQDGDLTFRMNDEKMTISIYEAMKRPEEECQEECNLIEAVTTVCSANDDHFKHCMHPCKACDEILKYLAAAEDFKTLPDETMPYLDADKPVNEGSLKENKEEAAPKLELKSLPDHLQYSFLGEGETFPIIISANLSSLELKQVLDVGEDNGGAELIVNDESFIISKSGLMKFHEDEGSTSLGEGCSFMNDHLGREEIHAQGRPLIDYPP